MRQLTFKQQKFIDEYLADPSSIHKAAIRAGYSIKAAPQIASRLLATPRVAEAIKTAQEAHAERLGITKDRILQELWLIATSNLKDIIEQNPDGTTTIDLNKLSREQASTLGEVSITTKEGKTRVKTAKVRLHDKLSALRDIAKHLGMLNDKVEHSGVLTLEQLVSESMEEIVEEVDDSSE